jgi:2-octaprenyl-6-methoxyphenol hydroxylase
MRTSFCGETFDVVIAGGGFVGITLALALARGGVRAALVDSAAAGTAETAPRPIALAEGSRRIIESLDLWQHIGTSATPIRLVHVSDRGRFGFTRIKARDYGVEALGYVSEAGIIGSVLARALDATAGVAVLRPASVHQLEFSKGRVRVGCAGAEGSQSVEARLLAAADGGKSSLRRLSGIGARERDWQQSAITSTVKTRLDPGNVAYERFTDSGPVALLPMGQRRSGLVWTLPHERADALMALDDGAFLTMLGNAFGTRLGAFTETGPRTRHRLRSVHSKLLVKQRLALVGNAANHLHPVAGQGLNLGLRDAAVLAEVVVDAVRAGEDPGATPTLGRYAEWRRRDQWATSRFTDGVVRLFSNDLLPLAVFRDIGLIGLDSFGFLKRMLARRAMGLAGRGCRLSRGLSL